MRTVTIADVFNLDHGETIPSIKGRIAEINRLNKGTNDKGEWSIQNITLTDPSGAVKVKLLNRDELPMNWKGRTVYMFCHEGDKGMTGLKAKDDDYRGKVTRIVSVTPTAHIEEADSQNEQSHPDPDPAATSRMQRNEPPRQNPPPTPQQPNQRQTTPPAPSQPAQPPPQNGHATNGNGIGDVKKHLNRMANLYICCLEAGQYVKHQWKQGHEVDMSDDQFQACVSSMFIQASRENLYNAMPIGVMK